VRESANDLVDELNALGLIRRGAITLDVLDTVVSTAAYRAEKEAEGDPADAVICDELAERTREEGGTTAAARRHQSRSTNRHAGTRGQTPKVLIRPDP